MDTNRAKAIHLRELLASLGYGPQREHKGECWYVSPFRQETEPSFKVSRSGKAWYDHGEGRGGNVLDFVMQYKQTDLRGALRFLHSLDATQMLPVTAPSVRDRFQNAPQMLSDAHIEPDRVEPTSNSSEALADRFKGLSITKLQPLQNWALSHYLGQRGVDRDAAHPWLQEIYYRRDEKPHVEYFALAFANNSGGYELRNPHFQGGIGTKDITTIGVGESDAAKVVVFEGFIDFLSAIMLTGRSPSLPVIVLNSVAMQDKAIQAIRQMEVDTIHLYRDRDSAGQTLVENFREQLSGLHVVDESNLYKGYKDLNEYLIARNRTVTLTT